MRSDLLTFKTVADPDPIIDPIMIDAMQQRFLSVVAQGRKGMNKEQLNAISDGRIFTTDEAKKMGLIDQIGYIDSAIDLAKQEAGIKEARLILYRRPSQYANNIYSTALSQPDLLGGHVALAKDLLQGRPLNFFYLWMP